MTDLHKLTLKEAAQHAAANGAGDLIEALNTQIQSANPKVNAILHADENQPLAAEGGVFKGAPIAVKDNICVEGWQTNCASSILKGHVPPYHAHVVDKLLGAGASISHTCNMDEFAFGSSCETSVFGPSKNPWDLERVPGGSSGGSAAAVAADMAFAALGSDTGGSIRQPAAFCGVVGVKPTYGRVSRRGLIAFGSSFDQIGPITKTVEDSAMVMNAIYGHDAGDSTSVNQEVPDFTKALTGDVKGLKVGLPKEFFIEGLDSEIADQVKGAADRLKKMGAEIKEISLPHAKHSVAVYYIVAVAEASSNLGRFDGVRYGTRADVTNLKDLYFETRDQGFGDEAKRRILLGTFVLSAGYYEAYYLKGQKVRTLIRNDFDRAFSEVDLILSPTSPTPAFKIGEKSEDPISMYLSDIFTIPANLAGIPAMSLPCGFSHGKLPVGVQLMANTFQEETMLRAAHALEQDLGVYKERPFFLRVKTMTETQYEPVIGLEVHVQLSTKSKLFCSCSTEFGAEANANTCPVCMGMPGTLPVLNEEALRLGIKAGLALNCEISEKLKFDRKNYFYPDLPKAYQISQFDFPVNGLGGIDIEFKNDKGEVVQKKIGITRAHLEEDAGKLLHEGLDGSLVDYNRGGVPLLEIVSEPDIRSAAEAHAYLTALKAILQYADVSDCNMEEGSIRCDANVSVRPVWQEKFGTRTETKNLNSFRAVSRAIEHEIARQIDVIDDGGEIFQETRLWDDVKGETRVMRSKEDAHDYRYFPEPDLVPFTISRETVEEIRGTLPELPRQRVERFKSEFKLSGYDANVLVQEKALGDYFEAVVQAGAGAKLASNWLQSELLGVLKEKKIEFENCPVSPEALAGLVKLIEDDTINGKIGKDVLPEMMDTGKSAKQVVDEKGLAQVKDTGLIDGIVDAVIAEHTKSVEDFKSGKKQALGFLVGQVMKQTQGKANPKLVNEALTKKLSS